jgi:hypothetical protein
MQRHPGSLMDIQQLVAQQLKSQGAQADTQALWQELSTVYDEGGALAVKRLLQERVAAAKKRAAKEAREMGKVVKAVTKPRPRKRR